MIDDVRLIGKQVVPDSDRHPRPGMPTKTDITIRDTVRVSVKVQVDLSGRVVSAKVDSPGVSRYFAEVALHASQFWECWPANTHDQTVSGDWILRFEFTRTTTRAIPTFVPTAIEPESVRPMGFALAQSPPRRIDCPSGGELSARTLR